MRRSTDRILTTHAGKLPPRDDLRELMEAHPTGRPLDSAFAEKLRAGVKDVVRQQVATGIDIVDDGEYGKLHFHVYLPNRLSGFELRPPEPTGVRPVRRDRSEFGDFYAELDKGAGDGWYNPMGGRNIVYKRLVIAGPVAYTGETVLQQDIDFLREAMTDAGAVEGFIPSLPAALPGHTEARTGWSVAGQNEYYASEAECRYAIADALRVEYRAIVDAGFLLHIDDPWMATRWDSFPVDGDLRDYRKREEERVELLNYALEGIPEDRVRFHLCWGSGHGPHAHDIPLKDLVDIVLKIKAQAYSIEAGNGRHEHEWQVWQDVKLPDGKILIPGLVSHVSNTVEHPELVAWRIGLFAGVVGKENVIAGTDCGLGGRVHPQIAWAKLRSLVEGAALASKQLWHS
jgi:5-methyltetrahydropteroyltriglutamate--homocysteine methyltransferase